MPPQASTQLTPKHSRGRTAIEETPVTTRSRVPLGPDDRRSIEARLRRALAPFGPSIERATIRCEDVNGPRQGVDMRCVIKVTMSGHPSIVVEERAANVLHAVRLATGRVARTVRRQAGLDGRKTPRPTRAPREAREPSARPADPETASDRGSLIGRRVGRSEANLAAALERPEKQRGDALVDTAQPGVSATDRRAGGSFTARRNTKKSTAGMTAALEDSRGKPSRKSTRAATNRAKAGTQLARRAQRKVRSPQARAARAAAAK